MLVILEIMRVLGVFRHALSMHKGVMCIALLRTQILNAYRVAHKSLDNLRTTLFDKYPRYLNAALHTAGTGNRVYPNQK
jgi:hypothetical protein